MLLKNEQCFIRRVTKIRLHTENGKETLVLYMVLKNEQNSLEIILVFDLHTWAAMAGYDFRDHL